MPPTTVTSAGSELPNKDIIENTKEEKEDSTKETDGKEDSTNVESPTTPPGAFYLGPKYLVFTLYTFRGQ